MFETETDLEFDDIFEGLVVPEDKLVAPKRTHENDNSPQQSKKSCSDKAAVPLKSMIFLKQIDNGCKTVPSSPVTFKAKPSFSSPIQENRKKMLRKFPGPAGILPDPKIEEINSNQIKQDELDVCSQFTVPFRDGPWGQMQKDFASDSSEIYLPGKYNIAWIKSKMKNNQLINQKAPFLAAIVQKINCIKNKQIPFVTMTLKDATGQIYGTIIHDLYEEYMNVLKAGSVVILKQFGVLTINKESDYNIITITANSLVSIYSAKGDSSVDVTVVQSVCVKDFLKTISEVRSRHRAALLEQKFNSGVNLQLRRLSEGNLNNVRNIGTNLQRDTAPICKPVKSSTNLNNVPVSSNKIANFNNGNCSEVLNTSNQQKFNFKMHRGNLKEDSSTNISRSIVKVNSNVNTNILNDVPINRNDTGSSQSSVIQSSQISLANDNSEHQAILQNLFEGLDASVLFEDF